MTAKPCPHADYPVITCARCVQKMVEPPVVKVKQFPATEGKPRKKRPKAWKATLPDGRVFTYERVGLSTARGALRRTLKKRAPNGTTWEGVR